MTKKRTRGKPRGKKNEVNSETIKSLIVSVARKQFAEYGFNGASLKKIALEAKTANSLINYYFTDKAGLFEACMESFARSRMEAVLRILTEPRSRDDFQTRLELFTEEMISAILADPYGFEILDKEVRVGNQVMMKIFQGTLLQAFRAVVAFFEQAKVKGLLAESADPLICASLLFTCSCDTAKKDVLGKKFFNISLSQPDYRKRYVRQVVDLFMNGVSP